MLFICSFSSTCPSTILVNWITYLGFWHIFRMSIWRPTLASWLLYRQVMRLLVMSPSDDPVLIYNKRYVIYRTFLCLSYLLLKIWRKLSNLAKSTFDMANTLVDSVKSPVNIRIFTFEQYCYKKVIFGAFPWSPDSLWSINEDDPRNLPMKSRSLQKHK